MSRFQCPVIGTWRHSLSRYLYISILLLLSLPIQITEFLQSEINLHNTLNTPTLLLTL